MKMSESLAQLLDRYVAESGQTKTTAVERILKYGLDIYFKSPKEDRRFF